MNKTRLENIFSRLIIALAPYDYERRNVRQLKELCDEVLAYKQIEEELGIDLITLFKALKDGYYYVSNVGFSYGSKIRSVEPSNIELLPWVKMKKDGSKELDWLLHICVDTSMIDTCSVKDYGKTWALTKKELK